MTRESVAYLAGLFPQISETFVYREVRELRRRGWTVQTASLNSVPSGSNPDLADLSERLLTVYGEGKFKVLAQGLAEFAKHPIRGSFTLAMALGDAIAPGESLSWRGRAKLLGQAVAGLRLARQLRHSDVRHIHCHFAHAPTSVGMYAARQLGVSFSFTGHANDIFQRRALLKRKLQRAAFVACISQWHRDFYRQIHPVDNEKYRLIRCGVPVADWRPRQQESSCTHRPLRILTVCRLVEKKGVDVLLRGLREFGNQTKQRWNLIIAGDGPERGKLGALCDQLGCRESVHWLGPVPNERVRELMADADVFALACRTDGANDRDGIPVVLMEAMACGLPVIAGDLPAIRELVQHGRTGLLFDGRDVNALIECLRSLDESPQMRRQLAAAGRAWVEEEFSLERNVDRLEAAFDACLNGIRKESGEPAAV